MRQRTEVSEKRGERNARDTGGVSNTIEQQTRREEEKGEATNRLEHGRSSTDYCPDELDEQEVK